MPVGLCAVPVDLRHRFDGPDLRQNGGTDRHAVLDALAIGDGERAVDAGTDDARLAERDRRVTLLFVRERNGFGRLLGFAPDAQHLHRLAVDELRVARGARVVLADEDDVVRDQQLVDGGRSRVERDLLAVDDQDAVVAGAQHDVGSFVEPPGHVAHADQLADLQGAHEAFRAPLGGVDGAHDAVEIDGDRERRHRAVRAGGVVAAHDPHRRGHGGDDEEDEEERAHAGKGATGPTARAGSRRRHVPVGELRDREQGVGIGHREPGGGIVRLGARGRRCDRRFDRGGGFADDGLGVGTCWPRACRRAERAVRRAAGASRHRWVAATTPRHRAAPRVPATARRARRARGLRAWGGRRDQEPEATRRGRTAPRGG